MVEKNSTVNRRLLGDRLIDVVDGVRRKIHRALGTRPWEVSIITRRWSGAERGEGIAKTSIMTLDPVPQVVKNVRDRIGPAGREGAGSIVLTGVSLRYSEQELDPTHDHRTEVAYRLRELHGQKTHDSWYVIASSPVQRRGDKEGDATDWYLVLNETSAMTSEDGVDA